jgi:small-conductance mechanosensitive channel
MSTTPLIQASSPQELWMLLTQPQALREWVTLLACLLVSALIVRLLGRVEGSRGSVWWGHKGFDGVLFPVLALALAFVAGVVFTAGKKTAVLQLATPVLLSLLIIRLTARVLSASFPGSAGVRVIERSVSWLAWGAMVLWVLGILPVLLDSLDEVRWKMGASQLSLRNVVEGGLTAALTLMLALWVSSSLEKRILRGTGENLSLRKIVANLLRALLLFMGLLVALSAVGIDLTALSVLGGALGVGLGFGLQKIAANYVSGFVILAERSLRIGDMVKVDQFEGRITDIRTRYTVIRALNGREAIVPNELLMTQKVENSSLADPRVLLSTTVQIAYGSPVREVQRRLAEVVATVPRVLPDPAVVVQLSDFASDGLALTVNFWIADPENGAGQVRSEVNLAILDTLESMRVSIPFPHRVMVAAGAS